MRGSRDLNNDDKSSVDLKILHAPTTVGGNPQGLAKAERALGYKSRSITVFQNYLNYEADEVVCDDDKISFMNEIKRWGAIVKSLKNYNVLHYNSGQSIAPIRTYPTTKDYSKWAVFLYTNIYAGATEFLDMKIARLLGRVVSVTYQGSDARQVGYCRRSYPIHYYHNPSYTADDEKNDWFKRKRIQTVDKYADLIYAVNPDILNVLPERAQFIPYASVSMTEWTPKYGDENPAIPHIVHAPSNRKIKGTQYILDAFARLEQEGICFRYTLVENMSNVKARQVYETADLLVDQLFAGYYGGLAVELMALGKPVICYMREADMRHLPEKMCQDMPIINATPNTIYDVLKDWITIYKDKLRLRGEASRRYVEKWHDPQKIAQKLIDDYKSVRATRKQ